MVKCPKCGAKVNFFDKRCSKCGQEIKTGSRVLIGIVVIVIIIAIIGVFASGILSNDTTADVNDVNNADSDSSSIKETASNDDSQEDTSDSQDDASSSHTEYWASDKAVKFHKPSCEWAQKISESNKIIYDSREDAIADGRQPCGECNP